MQSDDMPKNATVTVRVPAALKRRLEGRARASHRSLSAQVLHDLATLAETGTAPAPGRFLGLYAGARVPTDEEIRDVRARLWSRVTTGQRHA
jgi:hypothetical protein